MATYYSKEQLSLFMKYVNPVELSRACGLNGLLISVQNLPGFWGKQR